MKRNFVLCILFCVFAGVLHAQTFWQPLDNKAYEWALTTGIAVHPPSGNIIITTLNKGMFRSTDNGDSWHQVLETDSTLYSIAVRSDGAIFVGGTRGYVFRSLDGGATWSRYQIHTLHPVSQIAFTASLVLAGTGQIEDREGVGHDAGDGVFVSSDSGETWVQKNTGISGVPCITALAVEPGGRIWTAISNWAAQGTRGGLYYSDNNGDSWHFLRIAIDGKNVVGDSMNVRGIEALAFDGSGRMLISMRGADIAEAGGSAVGCEFVAATSDITRPWEILSVTPSSLFWMQTPLYSLYIAANGAMWGSTIGGNSRGVFTSTDNGLHWERRHDGILPAISGRYEKILFAGQNDGTLYAVQTLDNHVYRAEITTGVHDRNTEVPAFDIAPNPVGESTVVSFVLPNTTHVRMSVVDLLGREVALLADSRLDAGVHRIAWNGKNSGAGMYYIVLRTESGVLQKAVYVRD